MGDHTAFFYGTLMAPEVLHRVIYGTPNPEEWQKKLTTVRPALLQSFRRHRVKHADYPAIQPHDKSSVRGSIVTGLTDGDLWRLDVFEGDQYVRQKVQVKVLQDMALDQLADETDLHVVEEAEAETYVWQDESSALEDTEWDFEQFKQDKMKAWMGYEDHPYPDVLKDGGFADVDEAVAAKEGKPIGHDPTGGRGQGGKISQQLKEAAV